MVKAGVTRGLVSLGLETLTLTPGVLRHSHTGAHLVTQTCGQSTPAQGPVTTGQ